MTVSHNLTSSTTYLTCTGKWKAKQEMPREGYWHNNERDTLRGILLHYFRTGDTRAFDLAAIAAQHAFDVDIRHHPHCGMYTHSYGHCYGALGAEHVRSALQEPAPRGGPNGAPRVLDAVDR